MDTPRIFVSHSNKDNKFCVQLVQHLRQTLKDESAVWFDRLGGLYAGVTWWREIMRELKSRQVFIVVLSPDAAVSKWVNDEINLAWRQKNNEGKLIIPILYRTCDIREDLATLQMIQFLSSKTYVENFNELLKALGLPENFSRAMLSKFDSIDELPDEGENLNRGERIVLELTLQAIQRLDQLKDISKVSTRAEVIRQALILYEWVIEEADQESTLQIVDNNHNIAQRVPIKLIISL